VEWHIVFLMIRDKLSRFRRSKERLSESSLAKKSKHERTSKTSSHLTDLSINKNITNNKAK